MKKGGTLPQNREEDEPVELRVLRYFLAVVRMQSVSAAAAEAFLKKFQEMRPRESADRGEGREQGQRKLDKIPFLIYSIL